MQAISSLNSMQSNSVELALEEADIAQMQIAVAAPHLALALPRIEQRRLLCHGAFRGAAQRIDRRAIERRATGTQIGMVVGDYGSNTGAAAESRGRLRARVEFGDDVAEPHHQ